jgi:hypothetical protein
VYVLRRIVFGVLVGLLGAASLAFGLGAGGQSRDDGRGEKLLRSSLAPSFPTDPRFHNVAPGGVPWVLARGEVRIKDDGELDLEVRGLVIPPPTRPNDPDGVLTVSASLFCGADANTTPAATSGQVPLSRTGDAEIEERVALPASCLAPIVLVHPNGSLTRYIAVSGWKT